MTGGGGFRLCGKGLGYGISQRKKLKLLLEGLQQGEEIPKKSTYTNKYTHYIISGALSLSAVLTIFFTLFSMIGGWERDVSDYEELLPMIQLEDLHKEDAFALEEAGYRNNELRYDRTELAPVIYELHERGEVQGEMWKDGSGTYSPSLSSEYYEVRLTFLGKRLVRELMEDALEFHRYEPIAIEELYSDEFDDAILVRSRETQMFFGRMGKSVLYIRYHGYEDFSVHLEKIYDTLSSYQKEKM